MDNNKLIKLLHTFTKKEWRNFVKLVESPYFNKDKQCLQLLQLLQKELLKDSTRELSRVRLEQQFFKLSGKDSAQLNVKLSTLTRLAEHFLILQSLEPKSLYSKHLLLNNLAKRGLNDHFERVYKKNAHRHQMPKKVSVEFYRDKLLIEDDFLDYITSMNNKMNDHENIQGISDALDKYYILEKINIFTKLLPFKNMYQTEYDTASFEVLESLIQLPRFTNHPVLRTYHAAFQTLRFPSDVSHFRVLCELLETNGQFIEAPDLYKLYSLCTNYCIEKITSGHLDFHHEMYQLYRKIEENGLFLLEEYVEISLLRNTINIALKVGEYEWAEYIVEKYKSKITPKLRESIYSYCHSILSFHKKKYGETISHLSKVQGISSTFDIGVKLILMKAYYEQDKDFCYRTEQVFRSFKAFIRQHRVLSNQRKEGCINFTNILNNLYRIKHKEGKMTLHKVMKKIEEHDLIIEKYWLTKKIEELA